MDKRFQDLYMDVASRMALMSRARRLQVGCVIVKDNRIISMSWNGTPAGSDNTCEEKVWMPGDVGGWLAPEEVYEQWPYAENYIDANGVEQEGRYKLVTKPTVLHSEMNALMKLARSTESGEGADLFVTHSPCLECAKGIFQTGIKQVFYREPYRDDAGIKFLNSVGLDVTRI